MATLARPSPKSSTAGLADLAIRLAIAFDATPETWMNQQTQYDLGKVGKKRKVYERAQVAAMKRDADEAARSCSSGDLQDDVSFRPVQATIVGTARLLSATLV